MRKDLHWVYVPEEKYPFYRVGCYSNFSSEMAPPGQGEPLRRARRRDEPDLAELLPKVADGLVEMEIIRAREAIRFARLRRIDHAYVIFDKAYFPSLEVIRPFLERASDRQRRALRRLELLGDGGRADLSAATPRGPPER